MKGCLVIKELLHLATPGIEYFTDNKKLVKQLIKTGNFLLIKTVYRSKKWYQFWKRKKPIRYVLMCIKDLEKE